MIITHLLLTNFRNYSQKEFEFSPKTTILLGPNGSGKTNILEAVFLLATGGSFRAEFDREMIKFGEEIARTKGVIVKQNSEKEKRQVDGENELIDLEVVLTRGQVTGIKTPLKRYMINGVVRRMLDFIGRLKVVLFWPEDLQLVTNSPSLRRKYLDAVLIQTDREYRRCLISYEKGLRQRNRVLEAIRDKEAHHHQLIFWDQLIIKNGQYLSKRREEYINFINNFQFSIYNFQNSNQFPITNYQIIYDSSIISKERLEEYKEEEVLAGVTLVGPHRDDFIFQITNNKKQVTRNNWRNLSSYGSRGEQRLAVLWLKLSELSYIESATGEKPVLLLDDILSEFDHEHRKIVFEVIGRQQTIITVADRHFIEKIRLKDAKIIELD